MLLFSTPFLFVLCIENLNDKRLRESRLLAPTDCQRLTSRNLLERNMHLREKIHYECKKEENFRFHFPVDGLVCLDEDRVALVHVGELGGLVEPDGAVALRGQGVRPAAQLADAHDDDLGLVRLDRRRLVDLDGLPAVGHSANGQLDILHASIWS